MKHRGLAAVAVGATLVITSQSASVSASCDTVSSHAVISVVTKKGNRLLARIRVAIDRDAGPAVVTPYVSKGARVKVRVVQGCNA